MEDTTFEPEEVDLRAYWQIILKRRYTIVISLFTVVFMAMLWTYLQKPIYQAQAKLLHKGTSPGSSADLLSSSIPALGAFADQRAVQTQVEIIESAPLLKEAAKRTGIEGIDVGPMVKVEGGKDSNVITVTTTSTNRLQAQNLANNLADVYVAWNLNQNRKSAHSGRLFLESQQKRYDEVLELAAKSLRDYQQKTGAVALEASTEAEVKSLADLEAARMAAGADEQTARAKAAGVREMLQRTNATVVSQTAIARNPLIDKLQAQVVDLNVTRSGLLREYKPTSSKVQAVDAQIADALQRQRSAVSDVLASRTMSENPVHQALLSQLTDAEGTALTARARAAALDRSIAQQRAELNRLPEQQYHQAELERNVQVAEKTYLALQDRYQSLRIAEESTLANAQVIDPARLPKGPVSPRMRLNLILSILVGLMVGIGLAALQEALDDTLHTPEDVEKELGLPILGVVGLIASPEERSMRSAGTLSSVAEAFRMVRSNIKYMGVDRSLRTIMVTSAGKGEGKSTTAANLAMALSQDGRKVVLVDGDLRRPCVHKQFGVPNTIGLTSAIVGGIPLAEVTQDAHFDSLKIIPAGPIAPNPAELLDSARFAHLLEELGAAYDMIVLDAPPVLGVADASVLAGRTDGVVMVVAGAEVEKQAARRALMMLQQARAHVLGVVLNKVNEQDRYYRNYYNYEYEPNGNGTNKRRGKRQRAGAGSSGREN